MLRTEAFWSSEVKYEGKNFQVKIRNREREAALTQNSWPLLKKGAGRMQKQILCMIPWEMAMNLLHIKMLFSNGAFY